jgi:glycosyltransferase involved in cell wall biosynthesis
MRINLLLHDFSSSQPFGGLKVQYEFANRLAARGHDVQVIHSLNFASRVLRDPRSLAGLIRANVRGGRAIEWFELDERVGCRFLPRIAPTLLRAADVTVIDSFVVAERIPHVTHRTGPVLHIVYEYPVWQCGTPSLRERLIHSLRRPEISHVATSAAVEGMLAELEVQQVAKITCGIDLPEASPDNAADTPRQPIIGFALRPEPHKGIDDMLDAIALIRARNPQARFECFGRDPTRSALPRDLTAHGYLDDAALSDFYRRCVVFVYPSHAEGWGLPAAEAMAHGAAVVVTANGGSSDFAVDRETALVVPPHDPPAIADAVSELLNDSSLRARMVSRGLDRCRLMSWERAVDQLEALLDAQTRARKNGAAA